MNRVFEILDEIIEAVESAKGVPMSSSAILNRPALLDLLDDLRDAFPTAVEDAREILEQRDDIIESARQEAERVHEVSTSEADRVVNEARQHADHSVSTANNEADRVVNAAHAEATALTEKASADADRSIADSHAEHERLVSEHEVHAAALRSAEQIEEAANERSRKLRGDADTYVDDSLTSLAGTLQKLGKTVDHGREALRERRGTDTGYEAVFDQST